MATKLITARAWKTKTAPFSFIKITNAAWGDTEREIIKKWIEAHLGAGWVYYDGKATYVFGAKGDFMLFKMWIKDGGAFEEDEGSVDL